MYMYICICIYVYVYIYIYIYIYIACCLCLLNFLETSDMINEKETDCNDPMYYYEILFAY